MLWGGPSPAGLCELLGDTLAVGFAPVPACATAHSNCRAVCVTGGMRGLPHDVHLQICSFILGPCSQQINP